MSERRTALVVVVLGAVVLVVVSAVLVPWDSIPGGHLDPTPAREVFTRAQVDRAEHVTTWARVWSRSALALSLLAAAWLGLSRRGRRLTARVPGRRWWVRTPLLVLALTVVTLLVTLPSAAAGQALRRGEGLSHEAWGAWGVDQLLGAGVTFVTTTLGVLVLVACARRWTRAWPAVVGGLVVVLVVLGSFVYPVVVEPIFNHFTPLPDGPLRTRILALAADEHVHVDDVLVSDASRRTTTLNAYVSGFGDTRRVVLYDNTV